MNAEPECFGTMFPSLANAGRIRESHGKVFGFRTHRAGFDREAWRHCRACPEYDACYRVSTGVLLLDAALQQEEHARVSWVP
jgi:hypothetical protein